LKLKKTKQGLVDMQLVVNRAMAVIVPHIRKVVIHEQVLIIFTFLTCLQ